LKDPHLTRLGCLVLAGGASARLFPVNKLFADPTGQGRSLLQQAIDRLAAPADPAGTLDGVAPERIYLVAGEETSARAREVVGFPHDRVLVEPARRGTLPAVLWAAAHLRRGDPRSVIAILPADHRIGETAVFRRTLADAAALAEREGAIVMIGVAPSENAREWTAYGAIRAESGPGAAKAAVCAVSGFEEKPSEDRALEMIGEGGWSWNSGIVVVRLDVLEAALARLRPDDLASYRALASAVAAGDRDGAAAAFARFEPKIPHPERPERNVDHSIDFALAMPLLRASLPEPPVRMIRAAFPWSDIGSWDALRKVLPADAAGNVRVGDVVVRDVRDSILLAEPGRSLDVAGVAGLVVVHASDGWLLVASEREVPRIKALVETLPPEDASPVISHETGKFLAMPGEGRIALFAAPSVAASIEGSQAVVRPFVEGGGEDAALARRRLLDRLARGVRPLRPAVRAYAWGGASLPRHLGRPPAPSGSVLAEAWLTSPLDESPARLQSAPLSLGEFVRECPEVLGRWSRALFGDRLPIFVKFLSTRFPPRAHLGLAPGGTMPLEPLRVEARLLADLLDGLDPRSQLDEAGFREFTRAYETWASAEALRGWSEPAGDEALVAALRARGGASVERGRLAALVERIRVNRARIAAAFLEVDLRAEVGNLLLNPSGTPHALFGLSHQVHPRDRSLDPLRALFARLATRIHSGAEDRELDAIVQAALPEIEAERRANAASPKNEAWLPFEVEGEILLAEIQQAADVTWSLADFHTPFVRRAGRVEFRKGDPRRGLGADDLARAVEACDPEARSLASLRRPPVELPAPAGADGSGARLYRLVDEPSDWPFFTAYRAHLHGSSAAPAHFEGRPPAGAFQEIVVLAGEVTLLEASGARHRLTPGIPAFVPATFEGRYRLETRGEASLLFVGPPTPRGGSPGGA